MKGWRGFVGAMAFVVGLGGATPAHAGYLEEAGWGALTVFTNVIYMPAKLVYATLGGITGGLAFALTGGDTQTAETVWVTSMGGTYVVTPSMLRGEDAIAFSGTPNTMNALDTGEPAPMLEENQLGGSRYP
jgi:hypothetical protein